MSEEMMSLTEEVERMKRFDAAVAEALKGVRLLLGWDGRAGENLSGLYPLTPFLEMTVAKMVYGVAGWFARHEKRKPVVFRIPVGDRVVSMRIKWE